VAPVTLLVDFSRLCSYLELLCSPAHAAALAASPTAVQDLAAGYSRLEERRQRGTESDAEEMGEAEDEETLCPPASGTGFFPVLSYANHSCAPNALITYEGNSQARLVALRALAPGEEICVSYIEEEQPLEERRADLFDYGFVCACSRCQAEASS
jgi:hypothetical protein